MPEESRGRSLCALLLAAWSFSATCQSTAPAVHALTTVASASLTLEQVVRRLQENNAERAAALNQYEATRVYRMQYRGFPSNRDAEMVVHDLPRSEFQAVQHRVVDRIEVHHRPHF